MSCRHQWYIFTEQWPGIIWKRFENEIFSAGVVYLVLAFLDWKYGWATTIGTSRRKNGCRYPTIRVDQSPNCGSGFCARALLFVNKNRSAPTEYFDTSDTQIRQIIRSCRKHHDINLTARAPNILSMSRTLLKYLRHVHVYASLWIRLPISWYQLDDMRTKHASMSLELYGNARHENLHISLYLPSSEWTFRTTLDLSNACQSHIIKKKSSFPVFFFEEMELFAAKLRNHT